MNSNFTTLLSQIYDGPAWHGPSVMEVLKKVSEDRIQNSYKNSHSIVEIIGHMTAWRIFVIEQLKDNSDYRVSDDINFPKSNDLKSEIERLNLSQKNLIDAISNFPEDRLDEKVDGKSFSFKDILFGVIHHDLYHIGQISLLNR